MQVTCPVTFIAMYSKIPVVSVTYRDVLQHLRLAQRFETQFRYIGFLHCVRPSFTDSYSPFGKQIMVAFGTFYTTDAHHGILSVYTNLTLLRKRLLSDPVNHKDEHMQQHYVIKWIWCTKTGPKQAQKVYWTCNQMAQLVEPRVLALTSWVSFPQLTSVATYEVFYSWFTKLEKVET